MAWFASGTGSAFAVRHQPEKGRRENIRVGGAATPTAASYCSAKFSQAAGTAPACIFIPTRTTPGPKRLPGGTDGPSAGLLDGSGGSCSGRAGPPAAATSYAVSGLRGGTPCRFELCALGTTGKGAGSFATAPPLPRSCESPARSPAPPAGPPDDGNLENAFPAGEPTPYGPAPSPPVNRRTAPGSPEGERKTHGRLRQMGGGVGYFFHAAMAGTSLDNVFYELLHYG